MAPPTPEQLAAIEARLRAILVPYEGRLEPATIYGAHFDSEEPLARACPLEHGEHQNLGIEDHQWRKPTPDTGDEGADQ